MRSLEDDPRRDRTKCAYLAASGKIRPQAQRVTKRGDFCISYRLGVKNGCPRRDPRQNFAGLDTLRKRKGFDEKSAVAPKAEATAVREPLGPLGRVFPGSFLGQAVEGGEGSIVYGNS